MAQPAAQCRQCPHRAGQTASGGPGFLRQQGADTHSVAAGGLHDLAQADAHALPLVTLRGPQALLEDGDDLGEDLLP